MKNHVASGFPIVIGAIVDDAFVRLAQRVYRTRGGAQLGGRAIVIVGYDDAQSAFKLINSWGKSWGTAGYGYVGYPALKSMVREAYVVHDIVTFAIAGRDNRTTAAPDGLHTGAQLRARLRTSRLVRADPYGVNALLNGAPCNGRPNAAEYEFFVVSGGLYRMSAEYASAEARPLNIILNGSVLMTDAWRNPRVAGRRLSAVDPARSCYFGDGPYPRFGVHAQTCALIYAALRSSLWNTNERDCCSHLGPPSSPAFGIVSRPWAMRSGQDRCAHGRRHQRLTSAAMAGRSWTRSVPAPCRRKTAG